MKLMPIYKYTYVFIVDKSNTDKPWVTKMISMVK